MKWLWHNLPHRTFVFLQYLHPEDGCNGDRNMLVNKMWSEYIINSKLHFVGFLLWIMYLIFYFIQQLSPFCLKGYSRQYLFSVYMHKCWVEEHYGRPNTARDIRLPSLRSREREAIALLGGYAAYVGSLLPTWRDSLSVLPVLRVKQSRTVLTCAA